jgi:hypothetical protein
MDPYSAAKGLLGLVRLCVVQFAIMGTVALLLYNSAPTAAAIYDYLGPLENYLPILRRYHQFLEASGNVSGFPILFSIALANIIIQLLFLFVIIFVLRQKTSTRSADRFAIKRDALFLILLAAALTPSVELVVGPYDLASMWHGAASGQPSDFSMYFRYSLVVPAANILLSFLILTRFGFSASRVRQI